MYLRVTMFKSKSANLDEDIAYFKDKIIPSLSKLPGFVGATATVNREQATGSASTLWESLEAMNGAEQAAMQARLESEEATGMEVVDVDRFEVTIMETPAGGAQLPSYTRVITGYADPAKAGSVTEKLREQLPFVKQQPGFRAFVAGVNRLTGRGFTVSSWDSPEARDASNAALEPYRKSMVEAAGMYGLEAQLVETVVAEIKQPATA